jgi:nucleoside-diphosphate-sugar epimerase
MTELILVADAGGFIGGQLVRDLERQTFEVRAVDRKRRPNRGPRSQQQEHTHPRNAQMGTVNQPPNRHGRDIPLDL